MNANEIIHEINLMEMENRNLNERVQELIDAAQADTQRILELENELARMTSQETESKTYGEHIADEVAFYTKMYDDMIANPIDGVAAVSAARHDMVMQKWVAEQVLEKVDQYIAQK